MRLRQSSGFLGLTALLLLSSTQGFCRGGETGTLDEVEAPFGASATALPAPVLKFRMDNRWPRFYLDKDQYRRLRTRLYTFSTAPIPGWDSQSATRWNDRILTLDGLVELLPQESKE